MKPKELSVARSWPTTLLVAVLTLASSALAADLSEQVLYSFRGGADGINPTALIADKAGNLYGAALWGGAGNCPQHACGIVFQLTPSRSGGSWSETVLYRFRGGKDGQWPSSLIVDQAGNLYGTTVNGGSSKCRFGCGVVFQLTPPTKSDHAWTETVLYRFTGGKDGFTPLGLVLGNEGGLYGTTFNGGSPNCQTECGTVFRLTRRISRGDWKETVLYKFSGGNDGDLPNGGLVFDKKGNLYGTTRFGGQIGWGTVFKLAPHRGAWTETVLYNFTGGSDDGDPNGNLIFDLAGKLYGTTPGVPGTDGTVFQLTPPATRGGTWTETTIYHFTGNGARPEAGLIIGKKGNFYGTTNVGGNGDGSVFKLAPPLTRGGHWTETVLHSFTGRDGKWPDTSLIFGRGGALYGITPMGGRWHQGVVFTLVR